MSELAKAKLIELDQKFEKEKPNGHQTDVQFNPETLKVTYANSQAPGGDQSAGNAGQFIGAGSTKLALQLWFDCTAMEKDPVDDVRRLTEKVIFFMTPQKSDADATKLAPPGVCFQWGSFLFKGVVESLEQTLEFFSPDGKPLRASISLTLSQQQILKAEFKDETATARPGHKPLTAAKQDDSLQKMASQSGKKDWQSIAAANGIEDPLRMAPGALVDLNASTGIGTGFGSSVNAAVGAIGSGASGAGLNSSLGGVPSASLSIG